MTNDEIRMTNLLVPTLRVETPVPTLCVNSFLPSLPRRGVGSEGGNCWNSAFRRLVGCKRRIAERRSPAGTPAVTPAPPGGEGRKELDAERRHAGSHAERGNESLRLPELRLAGSRVFDGQVRRLEPLLSGSQRLHPRFDQAPRQQRSLDRVGCFAREKRLFGF